MLRIRNEARWIERVISSILPLCDKVFVMDDHSTDGTADICRSIPNVLVEKSPFEGLQEARDKNWLLERVIAERPEWIIAIDGDEMLAPSGIETLREAMQGQYPCLSLRVLYLWDREDQVRVDGVYGDFHRESVFKPNGSWFQSFGGPSFHCGNVPWGARQKRQVLSDVPLLHLGYLHKEDRIRKYEFYNNADPGNEREDSYKHTVVGDLFPSDSRFQHGGPLELRPLERHRMVLPN
jgi:glycosyltransferase involved in cell wall biosynthesis